MKPNPRIGIIGSGRLGTAVAKQAVRAGYEVRIANSRGPDSLSLILKILLPGVSAAAVETAISKSDVVILALPLNQYKSLNPELFAGKIVIDAMNYWPPTEGDIPEFMDKSSTSSEYIQDYLSEARVVKTLNHIAYNELEQHAQPADAVDRRALALAGNSVKAKQMVAAFIHDLGFDAVDMGDLPGGRKFQPDTALFNTRRTATELKTI